MSTPAEKLAIRLRDIGVQAQAYHEPQADDYVNVWINPHDRYPVDTVHVADNGECVWGPDFNHAGTAEDAMKFFKELR